VPRQPTPSNSSIASPDLGLPTVLRQAAADVIIDNGLGSFSLREVARRAGVSHAAPGYHFGDVQGLLTSLAFEGLQKLAAETEAAAEGIDDPLEQLTAIGQAYVRVAARYPAHCEVIFRPDLIDPDDAGCAVAGAAAIGVLERTIQAIADAHNPNLPVADAVKLCWSAMQGLVQIYSTASKMDVASGRSVLSTEELVTRFTSLLVSGLLNAAVSSPTIQSDLR
jgi:AcrR family transcriptional regulator